MSRRRRRKPQSLEELNWEAWIHGHLWLRTARNEVTHERFIQLEALAKDFMVKHPDAVATAIAAARDKCDDLGWMRCSTCCTRSSRRSRRRGASSWWTTIPSPY